MKREELDQIILSVKSAAKSSKSIIVLGDFNLDSHRAGDATSSRWALRGNLLEAVEATGLEYSPTPPTWRSHGLFQGSHRVSCLDHVHHARLMVGVYKSKRESWINFCDSIDDVRQTSRFMKIIKGSAGAQLGALIGPDNVTHSTPEDIIRVMASAHFPGCTDIPDRPGRRLDLRDSLEDTSTDLESQSWLIGCTESDVPKPYPELEEKNPRKLLLQDEVMVPKQLKMMSFRNFFLLLVIYIFYLLLGGYIFRWLENPDNCHQKKSLYDKRINAKEDISVFIQTLTLEQLESFVLIVDQVDEVLEEYKLPGFFGFAFGQTTENGTAHNAIDRFNLEEDCSTWNFYNAVFFSFTAITTIGYGHLFPQTEAGKWVCIFYSLLGVIINGVVIGSLATFFGARINKLKQRTKLKNQRKKSHGRKRRYAHLFLEVLFYLIPGLALFVFIPAGILCSIEDGWTYLDSFYYAIVTLTTIGFGDYVAVRKAAKRIKKAEKVMVSRIVHEILVMRSKGSQDDVFHEQLPKMSDSEPCLTTAQGEEFPDEIHDIRKTKSFQQLDDDVFHEQLPKMSDSEPCLTTAQGEEFPDEIHDIRKTKSFQQLDKNIQNIIDEEIEGVENDPDSVDTNSTGDDVDTIKSFRELVESSVRGNGPPSKNYRRQISTMSDDPRIRRGARSVSVQHSAAYVSSHLNVPRQRRTSSAASSVRSVPIVADDVSGSMARMGHLRDVLKDVTLEEFALATERVMMSDERNRFNEEDEEDFDESSDHFSGFTDSDDVDEESSPEQNQKRGKLVNTDLMQRLSSLFLRQDSAARLIGENSAPEATQATRRSPTSAQTLESMIP
eukprot:maker-scaffold34_size539781-snap-gene-3.22 protein:Tk05365 transcript:maker-scaffold34_size539781-snap-gene-3.22-mRNA-1 annotation:"open rectifier potassium channel protein 1"